MIKEVSKIIANYTSEISEETITSLIATPPNNNMGILRKNPAIS